MAQNPSKNQSKKPSKDPTNLSRSRSISTIPVHKNNISKFLMKLIRKKKQSHSHIPSISIDNHSNPNDFGVGKADHKDKISKIDKHILQFIPIPERVSSIMSHKSRNQTSNKPKIEKYTSSTSVSSSSKSGKSEVPSTSGGDSGVEDGGKKSGKKGGLKIKSFMKIKRREKDERRFELCKKKILMGERCRPLDGTLRYDKNGVLVPQDLPAG